MFDCEGQAQLLRCRSNCCRALAVAAKYQKGSPVIRRMTKLDRVLRLVNLLCETSDGVSLDDIATEFSVNRRTAERMRDVVALHFDIDEEVVARIKRYRISGSLRRVYTRPNAVEIAALKMEADARAAVKAPAAGQLFNLLAKVRGALDNRERRRIDPDLDALTRLQRCRVGPGPAVDVAPDVLAVVQGAILAGNCAEFLYRSEKGLEPKQRSVVPYGLIHGPITYLVGKLPDTDRPPVLFRLDRMGDARISNRPGIPPSDWDLDAWMAQSFGLWREEDHEIVLRVSPGAAARARQWRFHPAQTLEQDGEALVVRFRAGGLREIADHIFTWGGDVRIEAPEALRKVMKERLLLALAST